jgi:hypothetical protein
MKLHPSTPVETAHNTSLAGPSSPVRNPEVDYEQPPSPMFSRRHILENWHVNVWMAEDFH